MRLALAAVVTAGLTIASTPAASAVVAAETTGFRVSHTFEVAAAPAEVWSALVEPGRWWNPEHSWFGHPQRDFKLEARPGGCFCESGPDGGALHMTVTYVQPGKQLNLWGGLGPLGQEGAAGGLVVKLEPLGAGTKMTVTYTVGGYLTGGAQTWAAPVDVVIGEQFGRLERLVETGSAGAPKPPAG